MLVDHLHLHLTDPGIGLNSNPTPLRGETQAKRGGTITELARTGAEAADPVDHPEIDPSLIPVGDDPAHSPLDDISPRNRQILLDLLDSGRSLQRVAEFISAPLPQGLGIPPSKGSVRRFQRRHKCKHAKAIATATQVDAADIANDLASKNHLIEANLFDTVFSEKLSLNQLNHITRNPSRLGKVHSTNCRRRRVEFHLGDDNVPRGTNPPLDNPLPTP